MCRRVYVLEHIRGAFSLGVGWAYESAARSIQVGVVPWVLERYHQFTGQGVPGLRDSPSRVERWYAVGGYCVLRLSWLGRGLRVCMRVYMVCVSAHVFLPLTPCIRLELALTVHWAHLLQKKERKKIIN